METRAVVIPQPHTVEIQDVRLRQPTADEVVIQTVYTSISAGTERMLFAGQMPHPMLQLPVIPGYETVGRIVETGANVEPKIKGQWVYVGGAHCYEGINPAWGGQSAQIIASADRVIPLEGIEPRSGVLLALAATALHGVDVLSPKAGSRALVLGQGPVGQLASRLMKVRDVWAAVSDLNPKRLAVSQADQIINADEQPITEAIEGKVDAIIEASGSMQALSDALPLLVDGGTIILLGYYQTLNLPYMPLFLKEAKLLTAKEWGANDLVRCRDMIADGSLDVTALLTHELAIGDIASAYDTALNDPDCLKVLLDWSNINVN